MQMALCPRDMTDNNTTSTSSPSHGGKTHNLLSVNTISVCPIVSVLKRVSRIFHFGADKTKQNLRTTSAFRGYHLVIGVKTLESPLHQIQLHTPPDRNHSVGGHRGNHLDQTHAGPLDSQMPATSRPLYNMLAPQFTHVTH